MSIPPAQLAARSETSTQNAPDFAEGTIGAFLVQGRQGWPSTYGIQLEEAFVSVASSEVRLECQKCCKTMSEERPRVDYVRVAVDLSVTLGNEEHLLHVEELFPAQILDVLETTLDEDAAARVRRTLLDTLIALDGEAPIENLLKNPISPMRVYEPLLNALVAPPEDGSLASWLGENITSMLCGEKDTLVELTVGGCLVRVNACELAIQHNLRANGEIKLVGEVQVCCTQTGKAHGQWKSRAVLMKSSPLASMLRAPDASCKARIEALTRSWRQRLEENLSQRLADGPRRFMLSEVMPELSLCQELSESQQAALD